MKRDPNEYRPDPDGHFDQRVAEREIPDTAITKALMGGVEYPESARRIRLETTYLGEDYAVIIDPRYGYLITAYRVE